jgi:hypothetical protein
VEIAGILGAESNAFMIKSATLLTSGDILLPAALPPGSLKGAGSCYDVNEQDENGDPIEGTTTTCCVKFFVNLDGSIEKGILNPQHCCPGETPASCAVSIVVQKALCEVSDVGDLSICGKPYDSGDPALGAGAGGPIHSSSTKFWLQADTGSCPCDVCVYPTGNVGCVHYPLPGKTCTSAPNPCKKP